MQDLQIYNNKKIGSALLFLKVKEESSGLPKNALIGVNHWRTFLCSSPFHFIRITVFFCRGTKIDNLTLARQYIHRVLSKELNSNLSLSQESNATACQNDTLILQHDKTYFKSSHKRENLEFESVKCKSVLHKATLHLCLNQITRCVHTYNIFIP